MSAPAPPSGSAGVGVAISKELLRIHGESYAVGTGAVANTHVTEDTVICFLDNLELHSSEAFMISHGESDLVLDMRKRFQRIAGPAFQAAVERETGRRVTHFFSETALEPLFSIELFRLAPASR